MKRWRLHIDHPWSECVKQDGAPMRVYVTTPWCFVIMALAPGEGAQVYDWRERQFTERFSWLTFHPR